MVLEHIHIGTQTAASQIYCQSLPQLTYLQHGQFPKTREKKKKIGQQLSISLPILLKGDLFVENSHC